MSASRALAVVLALASSPVLLLAQGSTSVPAVSVQLMAGVSQYDYSGTGTALHLAGRLVRPFGRFIVGEAGVGYTRYDLDVGNEKVQHLIPEVGLQAQFPLGKVLAPYVGVGVGGSFVWISDATELEPTVSGALGIRAAIASVASLIGELRVRGTGSGFEGAAAEWTVGIGFRP